VTTMTTDIHPCPSCRTTTGRHLDHFATTVKLTAARSPLRKIITLADQASVLTDEQLRFRLLALDACAASRSHAAPRSPIGHRLRDAPNRLSVAGRPTISFLLRPGWLLAEPTLAER
jgi:hypothetical protein